MPLFSRKKLTDVKTNGSPLSSRRGHSTSNGTDQFIPNVSRQDFVFKDDDSSFLYVTPLRTKSRLSMSFDDLLHDHTAQNFFLQYLTFRDVGDLLKFWLDANSFYASALTRLQTCDGGKVSNSTHEVKPTCDSSRSRCAAGDATMCPPESHEKCKESGEFGDGPSLTRLKDSPDLRKLKNNANDSTEEVENKSLEQNVNNQTELYGKLTNNEISVNCSASSIEEKLRKSISADAVKIFTKFIAKDASHPIGVNDELRNDITAKICREDGQVDISCFSSAQEFVCDIMRRDYFHDYMLSHFHCKYQIDVLTSNKVYLEDILYNDTALAFFTEFLEQEGRRDLLEFWLIADNFRQHLLACGGKYDSSEAQDDAMVLYDKYFSLQATCPLGFSDAVRFEVEQNICREEGPLPDCFEKPVKIVFYYLQRTYLKSFLSSQIYFTYLSDLLSSARGGRHETFSYKKRCESDTSSEHSVSTQNTLLAMETAGSSNSKKGCKGVDQEMRIDTGAFNPDALWKRNTSGKLSFGSVNNLGQFIPEFEPEPDKKKFAESVLSKAMRKLVNRDEDKAKEEMAWQVAEMIVREVTSVTARQNDSNDSSFS